VPSTITIAAALHSQKQRTDGRYAAASHIFVSDLISSWGRTKQQSKSHKDWFIHRLDLLIDDVTHLHDFERDRNMFMNGVGRGSFQWTILGFAWKPRKISDGIFSNKFQVQNVFVRPVSVNNHYYSLCLLRASNWSLAWLILRPWRCRRLPKRRLTNSELHGFKCPEDRTLQVLENWHSSNPC
jgi:hypothetical protein